jgi:hypothetical protein
MAKLFAISLVRTVKCPDIFLADFPLSPKNLSPITNAWQHWNEQISLHELIRSAAFMTPRLSLNKHTDPLRLFGFFFTHTISITIPQP